MRISDNTFLNMKIIITLLCVVVMIQVSQAGTIERNKRSAWDNGDFKVFYEKTKQWMEQANVIVKAVVKDMPTTAEYSDYKTDFESFLENYEEQKKKLEGCLPNMYRVTHDIADLYRPIEQEDAPVEAKEVQKLFYTHGLKDMEKDAEEFFKTFNMDALKKSVESWTAEEKKEMFDKCNDD